MLLIMLQIFHLQLDWKRLLLMSNGWFVAIEIISLGFFFFFFFKVATKTGCLGKALQVRQVSAAHLNAPHRVLCNAFNKPLEKMSQEDKFKLWLDVPNTDQKSRFSHRVNLPKGAGLGFWFWALNQWITDTAPRSSAWHTLWNSTQS